MNAPRQDAPHASSGDALGPRCLCITDAQRLPLENSVLALRHALHAPLLCDIKGTIATRRGAADARDHLPQGSGAAGSGAGRLRASTTDGDAENLLALAEVCFIWGDERATSRDQKLAAYDRGRQAAERVIELEPQNVLAHFWYATNTARWGQTRGVVRSLFLLPTVQEEIQIILNLDSTFTAVYALAGNVFYGVPGPFGGDLQKAEEMFRKGLDLDPQFTTMRLGLGKTLRKLGRLAEAQRELQAVLDEKAPRNPADWPLKDSKEARELLASIRTNCRQWMAGRILMSSRRRHALSPSSPTRSEFR